LGGCRGVLYFWGPFVWTLVNDKNGSCLRPPSISFRRFFFCGAWTGSPNSDTPRLPPHAFETMPLDFFFSPIGFLVRAKAGLLAVFFPPHLYYFCRVFLSWPLPFLLLETFLSPPFFFFMQGSARIYWCVGFGFLEPMTSAFSSHRSPQSSQAFLSPAPSVLLSFLLA